MTATPASWKHRPFKEGVPIHYRGCFTMEQFDRLKNGLVPKEMEAKWFIYYERPYLFFHRSWTGQPVYRLALKESPEGGEVIEALWSKEIADASKDSSRIGYQPRLIDFLISNLLLGQAKPFPMPSGVEERMPGVIQHHVAGTGYPQSRSKPKS